MLFIILFILSIWGFFATLLYISKYYEYKTLKEKILRIKDMPVLEGYNSYKNVIPKRNM